MSEELLEKCPATFLTYLFLLEPWNGSANILLPVYGARISASVISL